MSCQGHRFTSGQMIKLHETKKFVSSLFESNLTDTAFFVWSGAYVGQYTKHYVTPICVTSVLLRLTQFSWNSHVDSFLATTTTTTTKRGGGGRKKEKEKKGAAVLYLITGYHSLSERNSNVTGVHCGKPEIPVVGKPRDCGYSSFHFR